MCREGAYVPRPDGHTYAICLDCIPYEGAPLRSFESWDCAPFDAPCTRCLRKIEGGALHQNGGPFCWDCGSPPHQEYEAWLLALRADPKLPPPWAGDRAPKGGG